MNPADQRFEDRIWKRVANLEKQLQDIKTAQSMGLDNFVYNISDVVSGSVFLTSGQDHAIRINFIADTPKYFVSELTLSFFINNDLNADYHWPDGAALTDASGLRPFDHFEHYDLYESDELGTGVKAYYVRMINYSGFSKTIHYHAALIFPTGDVT